MEKSGFSTKKEVEDGQRIIKLIEKGHKTGEITKQRFGVYYTTVYHRCKARYIAGKIPVETKNKVFKASR